jgi:O-antigen/teichoic acid export membrane protein
MALASVPAMLILAVGANPKVELHVRNRRAVYSEHLHYGRLAVPVNMLRYVPGNVFLLLLPALSSIESSGEFRAAQTAIMPALLVAASAGQVALPRLSSATKDDAIRIYRLLRRMLTAFGGCFWLVLICFGGTVMTALFGADFGAHSITVRILGGVPLMTALGLTASAVLRSRAELRPTLTSSALTAAIVLGTAVPAAEWGGDWGPAAVILGGTAFQAGWLSWSARRCLTSWST